MKLANVDWDKLRVFKAVADLGSITAAAAKLGETTPTTSRKIDKLERVLNTALFSRSTRGVTLTTAGKIALRHVNIMFDAAEAVYLEVSDHDHPLEGPVTIATGDGIGPYWIAPRLPSFHQHHPKVELSLRIVEHVPDIVGGEADICIRFSEPDRSELVGRTLGTLHYMFFAAQSYIDTYGQPSSLFELSNHRLIMHDHYVEQLENWAPKSAELKHILDYALRTNSGTAIVQTCANGGGIGIMPSYLAAIDPRLVPLNMPEVAPIKFWLTYTERVRRLNRGNVVLGWLRDIFNPSTSPWFRSAFIHPNRLDEAGDLAETEFQLVSTK